MCSLRPQLSPLPAAAAVPQPGPEGVVSAPKVSPAVCLRGRGVAGSRAPTFSTETSGILEGPEVGPLSFPARPLFSLTPAAAASGVLGSRARFPGERAWGGGEKCCWGPGPLGWSCGRPQPRSATPARPTLRPRGWRRGPRDAQKPPGVEPPLCLRALTSRAWHRAQHLRVQR